jgi:putative transcriptional regulator
MKKGDTGSDLGDELIASLREGLDILDGKQPPSRFHPPAAGVDVKAIRSGLKLSQTEFARRFGFPVATVREWEQGRRRPEQAARTLLLVIASKPEIVDEVLAASLPHAA